MSPAEAAKKREAIDAYMDLSSEDIVRLILCLLIEEALKARLDVFRSEQLLPEPVQRQEELVVMGPNIMAVGDTPR